MTPLRLCLDLNVFIADSLSRAAGRDGTACQFLMDAVERGQTPLGRPVQLVISWPMLSELQSVMMDRFAVGAAAAQGLAQALRAIAEHGPLSTAPHLILGGCGLVPIRDEEDGTVLDAAKAGRADVLATWNMKDFRGVCRPLPGEDDVLLFEPAGTRVVIANPGRVAEWLRGDGLPSALSPREMPIS